MSARVAYRDGLELAGLSERYGCVVLYRVPWDDDVAAFVESSRKRGRRVLVDVDDLVFDPDAAAFIRALDQMAPAERARYEAGIAALRRTLEEVDGVVVSTEPLQVAATRVNDRVEVVPNVVSREMAEMGRAARETASRSRDAVTIAYLSGTPTHDRDFLEAADAVLWALDEFPLVRFQAVGYLTLDERFSAFGKRIERIPPQPLRGLPSLLAGVDVNLAPLEPDNPFTEAKSCLKYLEAAVVGVPTVASARADFVRVIDSGANGMLADDPEGWRSALGALIESSGVRTDLGNAARRQVFDHCSTQARSHATRETLARLTGGPFDNGS
jgi:glycosyltransferase involved in cell wall biosynthesis